MKLKDVVKPVTEMAKVAQVCSLCGQPKTGGHYYYKGGFRCKGTGKPFTPGGTAAAPSAAPDVSNPEGSVEPAAVSAPAPSETPTPKFGKSSTVDATSSPTPDPSDSAAKAALDKWLKRQNVENYKINEDGVIDVDGDVRLDDMRMPKFPAPVKFGKVSGDFVCSSSGLTTLRGCPTEVGSGELGGDFMCDYNDIISLEGGPRIVNGSYSCTGCENLQSLDHLAEEIKGGILAQNLPHVRSLQGIHKIVRKCGGVFDLSGTKIESAVLGLLRIKGLQSVKLDNSKVAEIINKHLKETDRNIHECQEELIDSGFEAFADL